MKSNHGFTVVELMVAMAISGIVMASIYSSFYSQQKSSVAQNQVAAMQQNLRAAMYFMEREIRMAGYNPVEASGTGIQIAAANSFQFTSDITDDAGTGDPDGDTGDAGEDITYALADPDGDGDNDLVRNDVNGVGNLAIAENIDWIDFVYLDQNGAETATLTDIRAVQISLVASTGRGDPGYVNNTVYWNQPGTRSYTAPGATKDRRRRLLTAQIKCRNLGLL